MCLAFNYIEALRKIEAINTQDYLITGAKKAEKEAIKC